MKKLFALACLVTMALVLFAFNGKHDEKARPTKWYKEIGTTAVATLMPYINPVTGQTKMCHTMSIQTNENGIGILTDKFTNEETDVKITWQTDTSAFKMEKLLPDGKVEPLVRQDFALSCWCNCCGNTWCLPWKIMGCCFPCPNCGNSIQNPGCYFTCNCGGCIIINVE